MKNKWTHGSTNPRENGYNGLRTTKSRANSEMATRNPNKYIGTRHFFFN
jgi:hypothetical protein